MSLLMDALRKAEEAKKKAAQESKSEETTAVTASENRQEGNAVAENLSESVSSPTVELSISEIEEVPKRSAVPNLDTTIEFEEEDDYVLPTTLGTAVETKAEPEPEISSAPEQETLSDVVVSEPVIATESLDRSAEIKPDTIDSDSRLPETDIDAEQLADPSVATKAVEFDDLDSHESEAVSESADKQVSGAPMESRVFVKLPNQKREQPQSSDDRRRRTAQNVFAAKKSGFLQSKNIKIAAGATLAIVVIAFGSYFYSSLTSESTFNIPAGSYAATDFVDTGTQLDGNDSQLSIDVVTVLEVEESTARNLGVDAAVQTSTLSEETNVVGSDPSGASAIVAAPLESSTVEVVAIPEPSRSSANLQPEPIPQQASQPAAIATTIGSTEPDVSEPDIVEVAEQSAFNASYQEAEPTQPTSLISFRRQESRVAVDPNLDQAYAAYQQGSLDQAESLYRQTLESDPRQRDALLGLASIVARNGNSTEALDLYSRLLARNPSDPIARAGLMELLPAGSVSEQEAELKRLLSEYPDVAALSYAYGNFLASSQRWSEAQQTYFRALQLAKSDASAGGRINPDYAFNLAVSLEHLNQREPAQNYYREALDYSANHPAGFDLSAVRSRLANMAGSSNNE